MLTEEQCKAIESSSNYILVIAGPGTGKTTVLTERIIYLLEHQKIPEERIHAFTFTNKATREMENRISKRLNRSHSIGVSNFHSFTFQYLKEFLSSNITVVTDTEKKLILENLILERKFNDLNIKDIFIEISRIKNNLFLNEPLLSKRLKIIQIYYAYEEHLKINHKIDFDGMNLLFLNLLKTDDNFKEIIQSSYDYILVDEVQDINWIQYEILKIITEKNLQLFLVGDPNQSIYSFRGSDISILNEFINEYDVQILHLTINHRSTQKLVDSANMLISHNTNQFHLPLTSMHEEGIEPIFKNIRYATSAAEYVAGIIKKKMEDSNYHYKDFLIVFRQNQSKGIYDQALCKYGIPHYLYGIGFLEYKEVKYTLAYYRIILNHNDNEAFAIICNWPKRGIADALMAQIRTKAYMKKKSYYEIAKEMKNSILDSFIEQIENLASMQQYLSLEDFFDEIVKTIQIRKLSKGYYDEIRRKNNISALKQMLLDFNGPLNEFLNELSIKPITKDLNDVVQLMTIHQTKGLEAKIVFLVDAREELMPGKKRGMNLEEERRVFYVAITRAKEELYIVSTEKNGPNDSHRNVPSRFITELKH